MPRFSVTLRDEAGKPIGIACGRTPHKKCSTPGCTHHADKLCDHPIERNDPPKRGDVRLHREHRVLFHVWAVEGDAVTIAQQPPGSRCVHVQTVTRADWFAKSAATCDRPICSRCAVSAGPDRDICPPHARAAKSTT